MPELIDQVKLEAKEFLGTVNASYVVLFFGGLIVLGILYRLATDLVTRIIIAGWKYTVPFIIFFVWWGNYHIPLWRFGLSVVHEATGKLNEEYEQKV